MPCFFEVYHDVNHLLDIPASEHGSHWHCEVAAVSGVAGRHHVLGVEHLLCQLGHGAGAVLLGAAAGQCGEASHEEEKAGKVHSQLAQARVQRAKEPEEGGHGHTRHCQVDQSLTLDCTPVL